MLTSKTTLAMVPESETTVEVLVFTVAPSRKVMDVVISSHFRRVCR